MQTRARRRSTFAVFVFANISFAIAVLFFSSVAMADPPSRVARLGYMVGAVSFSPAGEDDWVQASLNRPLTTGDRLWVEPRGRAEIQVGGAMIRMNADTGVSILNLDDQIAQLQLTQGTLNVRVRRLAPGQMFEVDTPNLAFVLRQPGEYRIAVDADGNATTIVVRKGQGEVYGDNDSYVIDSRQPYRFMGTDLREYQYLEAPRLDEFDTWAADRDRRYDNSDSARYVSQDVIGYQDLDTYGSWRADTNYGQVWYPSHVAAGWAPYRDGHWAWIDPWGWTWMDDAAWGFAVSHYGRWANLRGTWGWVPGPVQSRAYYAPALVAFVGGSNFQVTISSGSVGGVAWFPLAPREVYRPAYATSRGYFENINRSNTVVNTTVINNYYNNTNVTNIVYANRQVAGAVVAVPTNAFVQSQSVARAQVRVTREMNVAAAPVAFVPAVAPTQTSVRGAANQGTKPPGRAFERQVVARAAPPPVRAGFAAQQQQLTAKPGRPLDDAERRQLKPAATVPAPVVKVAAPTQAAPQSAPPRIAPAGKAGDMRGEGRGKSDDRKAAPTPAPAAPQAAPPVSAVPPPLKRENPEPRGRGEPRGEVRGQPSATPVAPTQVAPQAPAAPAEQRGRADPRGRGESRGQPSVPPVPPQDVAPAPTAPPKAVPPPAASQPPEQRGRPEPRGRSEPREQRAPPAATPVTPPQAVPSAPAVPLPEQRARPEPRGKGEQRGQEAAPPPRAAEPKSAPPVVQPPRDQAPPRAAPPAPAAVPPAPPAPKAEPHDQKKPAADKQKDKKKDSDEQDRDEDKRKRKD